MSEGRPDRRTTFGLALYTGQQVEPRGRWYHDAVPLAEAAEAAGFDAFWVSEHHGFIDGYLPAPLSVLASVAARTDRLLLGTGVVLGPLRHPVRLAEEAAVVDQLSGGRLILGLGLGYADDELRAFELTGPGRGTRLEDLIHILRAAWTGEQFSFDGATAQLDRVRVTPTPFAGRQIPILLGGYVPAARRRAARLADGHIVGRGAPDIVRAAIDVIAAEGGPERSPFTFVVNIVAILDEDGGHPVEALRAFEAQQMTYESNQRGLDIYDGQVPEQSRLALPARQVQ